MICFRCENCGLVAPEVTLLRGTLGVFISQPHAICSQCGSQPAPAARFEGVILPRTTARAVYAAFGPRHPDKLKPRPGQPREACEAVKLACHEFKRLAGIAGPRERKP